MSNTRQTKILLAQSLQELMSAMPLEKITVNDIAAHAGVGRNTFYYHFDDKFDLVNWYFQDGITSFLEERKNYSGWRSLLTDLACYFRENKVFYSNALQYLGQNSLVEYMYHFIQEIFRQRLQAARPNLTEEDLRFGVNFFSGGILTMIMSWVRGDMVGDISAHYNMMRSLCSGDLLQTLLAADDLPPLSEEESAGSTDI